MLNNIGAVPNKLKKMEGRKSMKIINAKILDSTHLELSQPVSAQPGSYIQISVPDKIEEDHTWQDAAKTHFLEAYDDQDGIYDKL